MTCYVWSPHRFRFSSRGHIHCVLCCVPGGVFTQAIPGCTREGGVARMHPPHALPQDCTSGLQPHGLQPSRLLCPWNSPGKNTGVGCPSLLQGIFLTQGLNPGLLHCRQILYCLSYQGGPPPPTLPLRCLHPHNLAVSGFHIFTHLVDRSASSLLLLCSLPDC